MSFYRLRVLWYLKGNLCQSMYLNSKWYTVIWNGWSDANWDGCSLTRISLTGLMVFSRNSTVSWETKKQHITSYFSTEIEYWSIVMITCKLKRLKTFYVASKYLICDLSLFIMIIKQYYTFFIILFSMNKPNILRLIYCEIYNQLY